MSKRNQEAFPGESAEAVESGGDGKRPAGDAASAASGNAQPVRTPQVFAGACPVSDSHENTRVYRTAGVTRYCVCDDCGKTWKKSGPPATPKKERAPSA
jgi:hypothetical protein